VKWFATLLANVCIWIGWHLRDVFEALGPAFRDSFRDLWRVAIGSVPTWFFTYVDVFGQTIEAAAALVAPWITWIAATLVTVLVSGLGYWIFFVRTRLGPRCIEAIALRCCGEAGPAENEPVVLAPMARTTRRSGTQ